MQICVNTVRTIYAQVYLDLDEEYTDEEIFEMAGTVYIEAVRRANNYLVLGNHTIEIETISTDHVEVERE